MADGREARRASPDEGPDGPPIDTVLLYAEDPVTPVFLGRPLEPLGWRLTVVGDVKALKASVEARAPKAVVIPRRPRGISLGDLVTWLRARPEPAPAAIVLGIGEADRAAARAATASAFLAVPFTDREVIEVLGATTRAKKLIVVADDSPLIHRHTVPILEEAGYDVVSAMDGVEALGLVREHQPDLLLTDVEMPRMDGYALAKAIKYAEETAHLPVIICSSLGEATDLERGFDSGADDYLVKPVLPEELLTRVRHALRGTMPASRETVLVVDDSPAQRHFVADCLARQGFKIITAENGALGLEQAKTANPALILSDYDMPVMTGFEMVHALKRDPETRDIPIVMLTARDSRRDVQKLRAAGATAYLVKPFAQDKCIATVERTLAESRLIAYKEASSVYISEGAKKAAEDRAAAGDMGAIRVEEATMAVMFSDIVGFTMMSSTMEPRAVIEMLNEYFDDLCPIVKAQGGDIDKFIGDAIMAVYPPLPGREPPALRAVRAGVLMQAAMGPFNKRRGTELQMRIGINTGPLVRGDMGSRFVRRDFTVIGDTVNRANRYEANAPKGGVLASASTYELVKDWVEAEAHEGIKLKGVVEPVKAFVIKSVKPPREEP